LNAFNAGAPQRSDGSSRGAPFFRGFRCERRFVERQFTATPRGNDFLLAESTPIG
jgi:hypothetical protein